MSQSVLLPPKIAQQFADRAKRGEADKVLGQGSIHIFYNGREKISLVSLNPPQGSMRRMSESEYNIMLTERTNRK